MVLQNTEPPENEIFLEELLVNGNLMVLPKDRHIWIICHKIILDFLSQNIFQPEVQVSGPCCCLCLEVLNLEPRAPQSDMALAAQDTGIVCQNGQDWFGKTPL